MNIVACGSNKPGIEGNASIEKILGFSGYNDILSFIQKEGIHQSNARNAVYSNPELQKSVSLYRLKGIEVETLRHLKSAIANQLCLHTFEDFLTTIKGLKADEIPLIRRTDESNNWELEAVKAHELINPSSEDIKETARMLGMSEKIDDPYAKYEIGRKLYDNYISINNSIVLFDKSLSCFFKMMGENLYSHGGSEKLKKLVMVHSLLDEYLFRINPEAYSKTYIYGINYNSNGVYFGEYLEYVFENENRIPRLEEFSSFLTRQTKVSISDTRVRRNAFLHNGDHNYYDVGDRVFKLLKGIKFSDNIENTPGIGGCPFAKIKTSNGKNALWEIFSFTNECYTKLLKEFQKQGSID